MNEPSVPIRYLKQKKTNKHKESKRKEIKAKKSMK